MLPEFGASSPFQLRLVTWTFVPLQVQLPFQLLVVTDSVLDGKENASVQPLIAFGPVLVIVRLATKATVLILAKNEKISANGREFFVLNKERKVVYMGAMDDSQGKPKVSYLEPAIEAALKGDKPAKTETRARGCGVQYEK